MITTYIFIFFTVIMSLLILLPIIVLVRKARKTNKIVTLQLQQEEIERKRKENLKKYESQKIEKERRKLQKQSDILKRIDEQRRKELYQSIEKSEEQRLKKIQLRTQNNETVAEVLTNIEGIGKIFQILSPDELYTCKVKDFTGVYIVYNTEQKKAYVGQSKNVMKRLRNHFLGTGGNTGSEAFYKDYKSRVLFEIYTIKLNESYFDSLDELERNLITYYNSYSEGYNNNSGNKS